MTKKLNYTVITGASKGLGKCLAYACAKRHRNLILIALPNESVSDLANELTEKFNIEAVAYETDLRIKENITSLSNWIIKNAEIDMLINNAGIGGTNRFGQEDEDFIDTIMQINMKALVLLTHQLLPLLKKQNQAYILNIASLAAFGPMPYKTVYPASKAFVSSFSRGLNAELQDSNINVSVAYPGGMATTPEIIERMQSYSYFVKSTFLSPEETAEICIKKTLSNKTVIIPGIANKISRFFIALIPETLRFSIFRKNLVKEMALKTI